MSTKPDYRALTGGFRSIEELRQTLRAGCQPHFIQSKVAQREGRFEAGVLLGVDGMVAEVKLQGSVHVRRVGTLWPDRMARVARGNVHRDGAGRPLVRWNRSVNLLQFHDFEDCWPCFNVVDLEREPEYLEAWERLPAERILDVGRPCLECGEPVDPDDLESIEQHLHETGLPGRIWGAAKARGGPKLNTRTDFEG